MTLPAPPAATGRILCLSNVYDQQYHDLRQERIDRCLSGSKRRDLFRCLELASARQVVVLSSPPRAAERRRPRWLRPMEARFSTHPQYFCSNWDAPKIRVPLSWWFYALHVLRHTRTGDIILIDNYELIYVLAAYLVRLLKRVSFIFEYEDGKHIIDHSVYRLVSGLAETAGRRLFRAAILAHPALSQRLPPWVVTELVPGFVVAQSAHRDGPLETPVQLLYSGSWDSPRGVDLLLESLEYLPESGWHLHVSGEGPLARQLQKFSENPKWTRKLTVHGPLAAKDFKELLDSCDVGINPQRTSDPISAVTFPSKVFTYLSAGHLVVSSTASAVPEICGSACMYYGEESAKALAQAVTKTITSFEIMKASLDPAPVFSRYSVEGTAVRLKTLLHRAAII